MVLVIEHKEKMSEVERKGHSWAEIMERMNRSLGRSTHRAKGMHTTGNTGSPAANPTLAPARIFAVFGLFHDFVALRPQTISVDVGSSLG